MQRGIYAARDDADAREKVALAYDYYKRFDNIKGPGIVHGGMIAPLPRKQTLEELAENLSHWHQPRARRPAVGLC